jgi:hypothetical protein
MVGNMKVLLINIADWYKSTEPGLWGKGQMMKRKKHTEGQIICAANTGSAKPTFYNWKAKYGGLEVSEAFG